MDNMIFKVSKASLINLDKVSKLSIKNNRTILDGTPIFLVEEITNEEDEVGEYDD